MNSLPPYNGTVSECGNLFLAMELHAAEDKRRNRLRRAISGVVDKVAEFRKRCQPQPDTYTDGFATQGLVERVASAAMFDSATPIVVQHSKEGALSQFFTCRLLPFLERNVICNLSTLLGHESSDPKAVLARAIEDLAPGVDLSALRHLPLNYWAEYIEKRALEPTAQRILVILHFQEFGTQIDRVLFRQVLRRLARIPGFSVVIGVRRNEKQGFRSRIAKAWARPGRPLGRLDLGQRTWNPPLQTKTGAILDRIYHDLGPWLDWAWGLRILQRFHPQEPLHGEEALLGR